MNKIDFENKTVLVTGAAGFIGSFLSKRIIESTKTTRVIGVDCITDYYDVSLKDERLKILSNFGERFTFIKDDIADKAAMEKIFCENKISVVVNLAAQAGDVYQTFADVTDFAA